MNNPNPFKWHHFEAESILLYVRCYLRYALSYRDLEEMMRERGLQVDHITIYRWVQQYAPELEKRCLPHLKAYNDSWRVDEMYVKIRKSWMYLYRAVDAQGTPSSFSWVPHGMPRWPNSSSSRRCTPRRVQLLEGADAWRGKRKQHGVGRVYHQPVWSGCLS